MMPLMHQRAIGSSPWQATGGRLAQMRGRLMVADHRLQRDCEATRRKE